LERPGGGGAVGNPKQLFSSLSIFFHFEENAQLQNGLWFTSQNYFTKGRWFISNKAWAAYTRASATEETKVTGKQRQDYGLSFG
jgi:hypothetical protein